MKLLRDLDVFQKRIFVRADLDVPLEEKDEATRLTSLKPTIDFLLEKGAKQIIIAGHIGRPSFTKVTEGKPPFYDPSKSTKQLLPHLEKILGQKIEFIAQPAGLDTSTGLTPRVGGNLVLLENLRFWPGEIGNDPEFAKQLAELADIYVNEAFGNCHRDHTSMVDLPKLLDHAAGIHLEEEVNKLTEVLYNPKRPLVAIVGGAKLETKIPVIHNLSAHADKVLVGGELPIEIKRQQTKMAENVKVATLKEDQKDLNEEDIGVFCKEILEAKSIVWNGPLGVFEKGHDKGTLEIANAIATSGAYSIVGGGETTQFLARCKLLSKFSFVSSGGGAMLEFLAGKTLPGIAALG